jgi:probable HAF family extracellular repeat protein
MWIGVPVVGVALVAAGLAVVSAPASAAGAGSHTRHAQVTAIPIVANPVQRHEPRDTVADLGTLGGFLSSPLDVNSRGTAVGVSFNTGDTALRGFVWTHGRMTDIGDLGGPQAAAASINAAGQVGGWGDVDQPAPPSIFNTTSLFCNPPMVDGQSAVVCHALLWEHGKLTDLGTLGGLNSAAQNRGINDRGQVVGQAETTAVDPTSGSPQFHAFVWQRRPGVHTGRGHMTDLGTVNGDPDSVAVGINNHGVIIGISIADGSTFNFENGMGVVWRDGRAIPLPTLGGTHSAPTALNDRGQIVGESSLPGDETGHATLWEGGSVIDLGVLPGDVFSAATDITERGVIVGVSCSTTICRATRWDANGIADLNAVLPSNAGWHLDDAQAINGQGQIVGDGEHNGLPHAYLLSPRN